MPPAPCTTGSTTTAASSGAWAAIGSSQLPDIGRVERRVDARPAAAPVNTWRGTTSAPQRVHAALGVARGHPEERVAVVAAPPRQQPVLLGEALRVPVLQRHLQGDLDGHRAGVAEEHLVEAGGRQVDQPAGQLDGGTVGEPAEHHVAHRRGLLGHRVDEDGVPVAVDRRPPRRHAVDQLAVAGRGLDRQPGAGCPPHDQRRDPGGIDAYGCQT